MKKVVLQSAIIALILLSGIQAIHAQTFKVIGPKLYIFKSVNVNVQQGHNFQYVNTSGSDLSLDWEILRSTLKTSIWNFQVCDNNLCYAQTGVPTYGAPKTTNPTPKGDTAAFLGDWTPTATTSQYDTFQLLIIDHNNHSNTDTLTVVFTDATTGIENMSYGTLQFETSPNPVRDNLKISAKNIGAGTIEIFNLNGQKLQNTYISESESANINTESLNSGMYLLRFTDKSGNFGMKKFIKE